jgi:phage/plasmid-associated DNA primase
MSRGRQINVEMSRGRQLVDIEVKESRPERKRKKKQRGLSTSERKARSTALELVASLCECKLSLPELDIILPLVVTAFGKGITCEQQWKRICEVAGDSGSDQILKYFKYVEQNGQQEIELSLEPLRNYLVARSPDKVIDPLARDFDVADLFVRQFGEVVKFVDPKGDSYEWDAKARLWQQNTPHQTIVCMMKRLRSLLCSNKLLFTDHDIKVELQNYIHSQKKMQSAMLVAASINRDYEFEDNLNRAPWSIAVSGLAVLDLYNLKIRDREKDDMFSLETTGTLLVETDPKKQEKSWHISKLHAFGEAVVHTTLTGDDYDKQSESLLSEIYPNAHRYMTNVIHDFHKRTYLRRRLALTLTTYMKDRSFYWMHGHGCGGKSHLMETTVLALGGFAVPANKAVFFSIGRTNPSNHKTHLMALKHRRLGVIFEAGKGDRPDESQAKSLIAGDILSAREIYKKEERIRLIAKIFILSQHECTTDPTDTGFTDRTKAVIMDTRFWSTDMPHKPPNWNDEKYEDGWDVDNNLYWRRNTAENRSFADKMRLKEEQGGHLYEWFSYLALSAVECAALLIESKDGRLPVPDIVIKETNEFFNVSDVIKEWIDEACEVVAEIKNGDLISLVVSMFNRWHGKRGGHAWSKKSITDSLGAKGYYHAKWRTNLGIQTKLRVLYDEAGIALHSIYQ